jgi:glyoxylase-like metal-dependent hydrolase (beta-lactamase superfamily II)
MSEKKFASHADVEEKQISWDKLSDNAYAYTAEGDPNTGVIIGDDGCMIIDATATPVAAQGVIKKIREITDKPIKYVVLTHYHAVRVLGASGYKDEGLEQVIASQDTWDLIVERGQQDMDSEIGRFPRLFQAVESVPGLTWPTMTFTGEMTVWMGKLEVKIKQIGRGHTKGDTIVYLPSQNICFSGDLVEADAACYTGDAYLSEWPQTLEQPGRHEVRQAGARPRPHADDARHGAKRPGLHARLRQHPVPGSAGSRGPGQGPESHHGPRPDADGPQVRPGLHLRALPALQRHARPRRSQRHPRPAHLDRRARPADVARLAGRLKGR